MWTCFYDLCEFGYPSTIYDVIFVNLPKRKAKKEILLRFPYIDIEHFLIEESRTFDIDDYSDLNALIIYNKNKTT